MGIEIFKKHIREKRAVTINTGAENLNLEHIAKICRASQTSKASAVCVAPQKNAIDTARKNTKLPIFAISIHPFEILEAVKNNVDGIIVGNFEESYKKSQKYNIEEIYDIILETFGLINDYDVYKCVTIPACLDTEDQIKLAKKLEILDVDLIQTEGLKQITQRRQILYVKDAQSTIQNTSILYQNTKNPIMTSGLINEKNVSQAFSQGASAVLIGSAVNKTDTEAQMNAIIAKIVGSISHRNSINREIIRSQIELSRN